jgi:hypothetical protein
MQRHIMQFFGCFSGKKIAILIHCIMVVGLFSCVKDRPHPPDYPLPPPTERRALIANEGAFGNGNAALSVFDFEKDSLYNNVFFNKNQQHLGDVLQSITIVKDYIFLALNNSDKITVIDRHDYSFIKNIPVRKPRYMLQVSTDKLYVSSLYYPEINIIDLNSLEHSGKIATDFPNTEGMILLDEKVYACNWNIACNYIYVIDPEQDQIIDRIPIAGYAPQQIVADREGDLWVLAGNIQLQARASLSRISPSGVMTKSFLFPTGADIIKPAFNPTRDTLYYIGVNYDGGTENNGIYRMPIDADQLSQEAFIAAQPFQYFWGLGIDSVSGKIFIGDPKGFIQQGFLSVYNTSGQLLASYPTGVGPGYIHFE